MGIIDKALSFIDPRRPRRKAFIVRTLDDHTWYDADATDIDKRKFTLADPTRSNIIMACVQWISRSITQAELIVEMRTSDGEYEPVDGHPILDLLHQPTIHYSLRTLLSASVISLTVAGNAYWRKVAGEGRPLALWYLPHWTIEPKWTNGEFISYYEYRPSPSGAAERIDPSEIVHLRYGLNPRNTRLGLSPLQSLLREVYTDEEAATYTASLLSQPIPGMIISPSGESIGEEESEYLLRTLKEGYGGIERGKALAITSPVKVDQYGLTPQMIDLSRLRQIPEERVTAALGIPAAVVGLGTGLEQTKVGATMQEMRRQAWEDCIIPLQDMIAEQMSSQLLPDFESDIQRVRIGFDRSAVLALQRDQHTEALRLDVLVRAGIMTRAEARLAQGLPVMPTDDVYLMPFGVVEQPIGQPMMQPTPAAPGPPSEESSNGKYESKVISSGEQRRLVVALGRAERDMRDRFAARMETTLLSLGEVIGRESMGILNALSGDVRSTSDSVESKATPEETATLILQRINIDRWVDDVLRPLFQKTYAEIAQSTAATIGSNLQLTVNLPDHVMREIIATGGKRVGIIDVQGEARRSLFRAISEGRALGEGPPDIAKRIQNLVPAGRYSDPTYRAKMIARTETKYAQNVSSLQTYRSSEVIYAVQAFDNQIGYDDEDCIARNGQIYNFQEADIVTEAEHPNGTLSWAPVVD